MVVVVLRQTMREKGTMTSLTVVTTTSDTTLFLLLPLFKLSRYILLFLYFIND